jgi:hypothetical protein
MREGENCKNCKHGPWAQTCLDCTPPSWDRWAPRYSRQGTATGLTESEVLQGGVGAGYHEGSDADPRD